MVRYLSAECAVIVHRWTAVAATVRHSDPRLVEALPIRRRQWCQRLSGRLQL